MTMMTMVMMMMIRFCDDDHDDVDNKDDDDECQTNLVPNDKTNPLLDSRFESGLGPDLADPELRDPDPAKYCLEILPKKLEIETLQHLFRDLDPAKFLFSFNFFGILVIQFLTCTPRIRF